MNNSIHLTKKLATTGGNLVVIIPKDIKTAYSLERGDMVKIKIEKIDGDKDG